MVTSPQQTANATTSLCRGFVLETRIPFGGGGLVAWCASAADVARALKPRVKRNASRFEIEWGPHA